MFGFRWRTGTKNALLFLWECLFGAHKERTIMGLCALALVFVGFISGRIYEGDNPESARNTQKRTTNMLGILEDENRQLKDALQSERLQRNISEKNLGALRSQMESLSSLLVKSESEVSFFKQLLEERSEVDTEVGVRSFNITPDFREDSYTLDAVLIRNDSRVSANFSGHYELAINVSVGNNTSVVYFPQRDQQKAGVDFRFYHEVNAPFQLAPGAQILNARFSVYNSQGDLVVSKILIEGGLGNNVGPTSRRPPGVGAN